TPPRRSAATRSRASAARAACTACGPMWSSHDARCPKDLQALHRRRVRADRVRARGADPGPQREVPRERLARIAQGPARSGPEGPGGAAGLGLEVRVLEGTDP